jgi:hypothetical protein
MFLEVPQRTLICLKDLFGFRCGLPRAQQLSYQLALIADDLSRPRYARRGDDQERMPPRHR